MGPSRATGAVTAYFFRRALHVATVGDAFPEKLCLVSPRTFGATGCRIADHTRRELLFPKDLALLCHFRSDGVGVGDAGDQNGGADEEA